MIAGGFLALFIAFKVITALLKKKRYNERRAYLMQKYRNNTELVDMIMDGQFWKQQTADQLLDSLGTPVAVECCWCMENVCAPKASVVPDFFIRMIFNGLFYFLACLYGLGCLFFGQSWLNGARKKCAECGECTCLVRIAVVQACD